MSDRADAHMHLFAPGYVDMLPESCRRVSPDEVTLYEALRARTGVKQALVIGYEGLPAYAGNNQYISELAQAREWIRPTAYCADPSRLSVDQLETWRSMRFVGVSLYLFDDALITRLLSVPDSVWRWIVDRRWLISVNSRGHFLEAWQTILDRFGALRLLISHLGLPASQSGEISMDETRQLMKSPLALARFPGVHLKCSAFYALASPSHAYPHRPAWRFVECALESFGIERLVWGSDFSPALEHVSYEQTFGLFAVIPFLNDGQRRKICGENLSRLLSEIGMRDLAA